MLVAMQKTWYSGGNPEYQAGREYDVEDDVGARLIRRGVAVYVKPDKPEAVIPTPDGRSIPVEIRPSVRKKTARKKRK